MEYYQGGVDEWAGSLATEPSGPFSRYPFWGRFEKTKSLLQIRVDFPTVGSFRKATVG